MANILPLSGSPQDGTSRHGWINSNTFLICDVFP